MKPDGNISPAKRFCAVIDIPVGYSFGTFAGETAPEEIMRRVVMEKLVP